MNKILPKRMRNNQPQVALEIGGEGCCEPLTLQVTDVLSSFRRDYEEGGVYTNHTLAACFEPLRSQRLRHDHLSGPPLRSHRKWATSSTSHSATVIKSVTRMANGTGNEIFETVKARSGSDMWVVHSLSMLNSRP